MEKMEKNNKNFVLSVYLASKRQFALKKQDLKETLREK